MGDDPVVVFPPVPKNRHIIPLAIIGAIVAALTAAQALLIDWLPESASEQAGRTNTLLWFLFWASAVFFVIVTTVLIYSLVRFRAAPDDDSDGPPIHGNTMLEVVWTAVPSVVLIVAAIYGYVVLNRNEAVAADRLQVDVYAQQFTFTYGYPEAGIETGNLYVPVGRQVELDLRARDVIHDFWVPEYGIKGDAVPGIVHTIYINPTKVGTYPVVCAELCGVGHGVMRSKVIVMETAAFNAWLATAKGSVAGGAVAAASPAATPAPAAGTAASAAGDAAAGKTIFAATCTGCHTNNGNAAGVGPKLAGAKLTAERVRNQVINGGGPMPGGLVSGADLDNVVAYVESIQ